MRSLGALAIPLTLGLFGARALGAAPDSAKAFFQAGAQAYDAGRFDDATEAFEAAFRLAPLPAILFSMAQAERKQFYVSHKREFLDRAVEHYRAYLEAKGSTRRAEAADALADLEAAAARLSPAKASSPEPVRPTRARMMITTQAVKATVAIDDQPPTVAPFIGELAPGRHRVRVAAEGFYAEERDIEVAPGPPAALDLPLKEHAGLLAVLAPSGTEIHVDDKLVGEVPLVKPLELPAGPHGLTLIGQGLQPWSAEVQLERGRTATVSATMERTPQRLASFVVLGVSAAALAGGAACTAVAFDRQGVAQQVLDEKAKGNIAADRMDDYHRAVRQRDQWRTAAIASFGTGAGLVVVGGLMYLLDRPAIAPRPVTRPVESQPGGPVDLGASPMLLPGGGGVVASGHF
jgi:hypothetical protein